jgi:hypothetical protein
VSLMKKRVELPGFILKRFTKSPFPISLKGSLHVNIQLIQIFNWEQNSDISKSRPIQGRESLMEGLESG